MAEEFTEDELNQLKELANLDVSVIMREAGLNEQQAMFIKQTLTGLGQNILLEGISPGSTAIRNLFGGNR